tara:strand:- start:727 stop:1206 length:480 start_codon:yes stop_codon:yes gene_type:complete
MVKFIILPLIFTFTGADKAKIDELSEDVLWMSTAIYFEARSESTSGQLAVASVIRNRVESKRFPDSVTEVVTQGRKGKNGKPLLYKCAFSFYCDGKPEVIRDRKAWDKAVEISNHVLRGTIDYADGADHFELKNRKPYWLSSMRKVATIDNHNFYIAVR